MTDILTRKLNEKTQDEVQQRVNYILRYGIILSIFWLAGIGSLISIILGLKAMNIIKHSNMSVSGLGRARWCIIVGSLGVILCFLIVLALIIPVLLKGQ
jgi:membrane protein YqaA with SNARE-associated domain